MPKLKQSASDKHQYTKYAFIFDKNKLARLERTAKNQPNNKQVQERLEQLLEDGVKHTRNRKSRGHICKGHYNELGFENNQMNENMKRSKLELHWFHGPELNFNTSTPNHGLSMGDQFEALGYKRKRYVRKYKKTTR
jgi:hypothetical protein